MKKVTSLFLIMLMIVSFSAKSQTIPNLDFETWTSNTAASNWSSKISLSVLSIPMFNFEFGTKSTEKHGGSYAMELKAHTLDLSEMDYGMITVPPILQIGQTSAFNLTPEAIELLGNLSELDFSDISTLLQLANQAQGLISEGVSISSKPGYVKMWVKSSVADTIMVGAYTTSGTGDQRTPTQAGMAMVTDATNWTEVTVTLSDLVSTAPDKLGIVVVGGGLDVATTTSFYIDDVTVEGHANNILTSDLTFKVYPNPAVDIVKIDMDGEYSINIYDVMGKKVLSQTQLQGINDIDVSALRTGVYMLEVTQGEGTQMKKIVIE
ncbi:MAG: T9SS type A sorting domain-containing protein [Bacteroidales bacterium]|jgi:hypothetical protein|nr:T9SS type A sorting domain-containing protein [Bacteroidales bacterium]